MKNATKKSVIVKNAATPKKEAPSKFEWNEQNEPLIVKAYKDELAKNHANANSTKFLASIAVKVGAKSGQAVRSKLSSLKEYSPLDKSAVSIAKPRITKPVLADEIRDKLSAAGVAISDEEANSLANSNAGALKAVLKGLDMLDPPAAEVEKTAKK